MRARLEVAKARPGKRQGAPAGNQNAAKDNANKDDNIRIDKRSYGTSKSYLLSRLKRDAKEGVLWESLKEQMKTGGNLISTSLPDGRVSGPQHQPGFAASTAEVTGMSKQAINA